MTARSEEEVGQVRDLATRGTALGSRLDGLDAAVAAARGRLDESLLDDVTGATRRATERLRLSAQHTVVAIAGATGSGKSSTYNALAELELSSVGTRRPTTSWATAVVWGAEGAGELLQWLGIPPRYQTMRDSLLDSRRDAREFEGVVLMDLPDHDSTEVAHHLEVDRLVELADLLVWVVDPQKYADAALHDRYLKPLAGHQDVMLVVVNHIDTIPEDERDAMVADVRRLLVADGLADIPVLPISARHGIGMDELRREITDRVASKRATAMRVEADVATAARRLEGAGGTAAPREVTTEAVEELQTKVDDAAGVPVLAAGVRRTVASRTGRATTWPPLALFGRTPDQALVAELGDELPAHSDAPQVGQVQRGALHTAIREFADGIGRDLATPWERALRAAATDDLDETGQRIDSELRGVELGAGRIPWWAHLLRLVQWLLLAGALAGGVWWGLAAASVVEDAPDVVGYPAPAVVLVGCLAAGLVLAVLGRIAAAAAARSRARRAEENLRDAVAGVLEERVVQPVREANRDYADFRSGVLAALGE
ncbi:GTPase [Nocardioides sp. YIM 152588]|uniref:GTPase n=1 Tax=Nocardioides sp. YIM 152588 TaxID=3158259 RepID=UPI0032E3FEFC